MKWIVILVAAVVAIVCGVLVFVGMGTDPREAMIAWHMAVMYGTVIAIGSLFVLMLGHAAQASWLIVMRRLLEHAVGTLPVLALLFIPQLVNLDQLYPWAHGGIDMPHDVAEKVMKKRDWLNDGAWMWRTVGYLVVLVIAGELLRHWSRRQDLADTDEARTRYGWRMRVLSCVGFPTLGLMVTFAFMDWIMSLEPAWYSTLYGAAVLAGGFLAAVGLLCVTLVISHARGWLNGSIHSDHRHALGRVLFASICFWAYLSFDQYMLMWIADLPEEIAYWKRRQELGWQWVGVTIVFGHFVAPFFLLLSRKLKEIPFTLALFGGWMMLIHVVAIYYLVIPAHRLVFRIHWTDPLALLAVAGAMVACALLRSIRMASIPVGDPGLHASLTYSSS